jgi:hypothetical protein
MLNVTKRDVVPDPFPHVVKQDILPAELFEALRRDFPGGEVFEEQRSVNGDAGSRTGNGFDVYRGDPAFASLTGRSSAWREFDAYINSDAFLETFRSVFADHLDSIGLRIQLAGSTVNSGYFEPRGRLTETATPLDRAFGLGLSLLDGVSKPHPVSLFTRLDIHRGVKGYAKSPHCDRPNRLCSLIIYFTDSEAAGIQGGELMLFKHRESRTVRQYERHPHKEDVIKVAELSPKPNLGVFFPCQNNSYHGVTPITSEGIPRDFLYINISGRSRSLW